jgi:GNAT superfamily N-acetyltransferase
MQIRDATHDDAPQFADIVIACWRLAYRGILPDAALDRDTRDERIARMRKNPWPTFACERGGRVIAMLRFAEPARQCDAEIDGLYVHPDAGRAGVGRALLRFAAARCTAEGKQSLFIATLRDNQIGRAFYAKHGGHLVDAPPWTFEGVAYESVGYRWDDLHALA